MVAPLLSTNRRQHTGVCTTLPNSWERILHAVNLPEFHVGSCSAAGWFARGNLAIGYSRCSPNILLPPTRLRNALVYLSSNDSLHQSSTVRT